MTVVKKIILWVRYKIQYIIAASLYSDAERVCGLFMQDVFNRFSDTGSLETQQFLELDGYFKLDGALLLSDDKRRLDIKVGDYRYYLQSHIDLSGDKPKASVITFENIIQTRRLLPSGKPVLHHIEAVDFTYSNGEWVLNNFIEKSRSSYLGEYCKRLISYIEGVEGKQ